MWNQKKYQRASVLSHKPNSECCWTRYEISLVMSIKFKVIFIIFDTEIPDCFAFYNQTPCSLKQVWLHSIINNPGCSYTVLLSVVYMKNQERWSIRLLHISSSWIFGGLYFHSLSSFLLFIMICWSTARFIKTILLLIAEYSPWDMLRNFDR